MLTRRLLFSRVATKLRLNYAVRSSSQHADRNQELSNFDFRLPDHGNKQPTRKPLIKNLFLGNFDTEFLYFPEPSSNDRYLEFRSWIKPIEEYIDQCVKSTSKLNPDDIISHIREFGVLRATIDVTHGGLDLSATELVKVTETLSRLPWLGTFFIKNHILPVRLINKYGTPEQKRKFLPAIATGGFIPSICITEGHNKTSIENISASIAKPACGSNWSLKAEKNYVCNATRANLFLVYAYAMYNNTVNLSNDIVIALVENNQPGINCVSTETTVGQQNAPLCTVTFDNIEVPEENILKGSGEDYNPLVEILCPGRQCIAPQAVTILRSFVDLIVPRILNAKHFDNSMSDINAVKQGLAEIMSTLYSMESMVYYTAGITDEFIDQDVLAENTITEMYCANQCVDNILKGMKLIGPKSYLRTEPFMKYLEEALSLVTFDTNYIDSNVYASLLGLQYAGKAVHKEIKQTRNLTRSAIFDKFKIFGEKRLYAKLDIPGQLHQSMALGADALENCLELMTESVRSLFGKHGIEISDKHKDLATLSNIATYIYASVAVLSRASRSYSIGLRHSTDERALAVILALVANDEIFRSHREIQEIRQINYDEVFESLVKPLYNDKGYFISHALERID